ncbi:MAG: SDH family Clp fold serine proteinase, partial [Caulobacteraceae bacterium]
SEGADGEKASQAEVPGEGRRRPGKTPMFTARNSARYERQDLMRAINTAENTDLICYIAGVDTQITRDDLLGFVDMLHNVEPGRPVDLMLHTCGGDVDACEKLVAVLHAKVGASPLRVIIPDMAKSAGTLMALGANAILMSDTSELGMIDPQFPMRDRQGNEIWHSVTAYLEAYEEHAAALRANPKDPMPMLMLDSFDPKVVRKFQGIVSRVRTFAEDQLKRQGLPASTISAELLSSSRWKTHGQPIRHADATQLGLPVVYVPDDDPRWARYWRLYCLQRLEIGEGGKIFESSFVSQVIGEP